MQLAVCNCTWRAEKRQKVLKLASTCLLWVNAKGYFSLSPARRIYKVRLAPSFDFYHFNWIKLVLADLVTQ